MYLIPYVCVYMKVNETEEHMYRKVTQIASLDEMIMGTRTRV